MILLVDLKRSAVAAIDDCLARDEFIEFRSVDPVAPQLI